MGYSYDSAGRLCCDACPKSGGVRKRACRFKVRTPEGHTLPYCYPPALCDDCYRARGGAAGIHGEDCRAGAAKSQERYDASAARKAAGELLRRAAWGDWCPTVPKGWVGVLFQGASAEAYHAVTSEVYASIPLGTDASVDDYAARAVAIGQPAPVPWSGPPDGRTTKEVRAVEVLPPAPPVVEPEPAPMAAIERDLFPGTYPGGFLFPGA